MLGVGCLLKPGDAGTCRGSSLRPLTPLPGGPRFAAPAPGAALGTPRVWSSLWTWHQEGVGGGAQPLGSAQGLGGGGPKPRNRSKGWQVFAPARTLPFGAGVPGGARPPPWPGRSECPGHLLALVSRCQPQRPAPPPLLGTSQLCAQCCHLLLPKEGTTSPGLAPLLPSLEGPHLHGPPESSLHWGHRKYTQAF